MAAYYEFESYRAGSAVNISSVPEITFDSTTSISVKISKVNMTAEPVNYSVTYYKVDAAGAMISGTSQTATKTSNPFTIALLYSDAPVS